MRLRSDFITQDIDDVCFIVPVGNESFSGLVKGNKTAAFIVDLLKEDTTEDKIVDAMCAKYNASREEIASDVSMVLGKLRSINAIEE